MQIKMLKKDMIKRIIREKNLLYKRLVEAVEQHGEESIEAIKAEERWASVYILTITLNLGQEVR